MDFFYLFNRLKYFILDKWWDFQYKESYWYLRRKFNIYKFNLSKILYNFFYFNEDKISIKLQLYCLYSFLKEFFINMRYVFFISLTIFIAYIYGFFSLTDLLNSLNGQKDLINSFLISTPSVLVLLIGLYFSSITNMSQKIDQLELKELIIREPLGRVYMYSMITLITICLVSCFFTKEDTKVAFTLVACFLLIFLIAIFPKIATNSFFLFAPSFMASMIHSDILNLLRITKNKGFYSIFLNSIHFHFYAKKEVQKKIDTFQKILDFLFSKGQMLKSQTKEVFKYIFYAQTNFNKLRPLIDEQNEFYDINKPYNELDRVLEKSTYKNYYWIDDKVLELFLKTLKKLKQEKDLLRIRELVSLFIDYFPKNLGYSWDVDYFYKIFPKIKESFKSIIFDRSFNLSDRINISRYLANIIFSVSYESHIKVKDISKNISYDIDNTSKALLNKKILVKDFFIKSFCDDLLQKLQVECKSSKRITPKWFLTQVIAKKYSEKALEIYKLNFENTKDLLDDFQAQPTHDINENFENSCIYYSILKIRIDSLECMKHFKKDWIQFIKNLKENEKVSDLKIPVMTEEYCKKEIDDELFNCYTKISEILTHLYKPSSQEDLNFFNEAYGIVREKIISLLVKSESQYQVSFKKCFENLFFASILIKDNFLKKTGHFETVSFIKNMESVESMVFLSSYILLSSKVCKKPDLINDHIDLWKKVFSKLGEGDLSKGIKVFLKYLSLYKNSSQEIRYESIWEEQFREFLIKKGYKTKNPYYDSLRLSSEGQILQKSDEKKASCKYLEFALKNYSDSFLMKDLFIIYILEEETFQVEKDIKQKYEKNMNLYRKYKIYIESLKK